MPSPMVHLLVAHEISPKSPDSFWVGNFAPDYTNDRQKKDEIHYRNASNRMEVLSQLRKKMSYNNPFEAGWLLHLFVDTCWDEIMIPEFQQKYRIPDWFVKYREETALASFYLYHHMDWTTEVWTQILKADLSNIPSWMPIIRSEAEWYRDRLYRRHSESKTDSISLEYRDDILMEFARNTAQKYSEWIKV